MNDKPECEHEWEDVPENIIADNERFNYQTQHVIIRRVCKKCGEKWVKDYVVEG